MSFTITNDHGGYLVKVGGLYDGGWPLSYTADPLLEPLLTRVIVQTGFYHVEDLLGLYRDQGDSIHENVGGSKPIIRPYNGKEDWQNYGSNLASVTAALRLLSGNSALYFEQGDQKQTDHRTYRGDIGPHFGEDPFVVGSVNDSFTAARYPVTYEIPSWKSLAFGDALGFDTIQVTKDLGGFIMSPYPGPAYDLPGTKPTHNALMLFTYLRDTLIAGTSLSWYNPHRNGAGSAWYEFWAQYTNIEFIISPTMYSIEYDHYWRVVGHGGAPENCWQTDHSVYTFTLGDPTIPATDHLTEGLYVLPLTSGISFAYSKTHVARGGSGAYDLHLKNWLGYYAYPGVVKQGQIAPSSYLFCSPLLRSGYGQTYDVGSFLSKDYLGKFSRGVSVNFRSIRLSSFQSDSDALDNLVGQIDGNLVETIGEASEFLEILPDLRSAISSVTKLRRGQVLSSVKDMLDFLTGLRLQTQFSWSPELQLVQETLPQLVSLMRRLSNLEDRGYVLGYGKFEYEFPEGEFGRPSSHLTTRTRVIANLDPQSVLARVLGVRAASLLPSPSSLWDLVPFSFVVDWFIGVGDRLHQLESIGFLQIMNVRCYTRTYLITSDLTDAELATGMLERSNLIGAVAPHMRIFVRDVSSLPPRIANGKYDFALPSHPPSWMTSGSLAWQLFVR